VHDAIEARDWHHVVFYDGDGDELATIEARPAAAAAAALPVTGRPLETDLEVAMRFVDRAMDKAFALRRDETSAVLRTVADQAASFGLVVKELAASIGAIGELNRQHVAAAIAAAADAGDDDGGSSSSKLTPKEWAELAALVAPGLAPHVMPILQPMLPGLLEKFLPMAAQAVAPELAKVVAPGIQVRTEAPPADAKPANGTNGANGKH
jgi:hypothetical protein